MPVDIETLLNKQKIESERIEFKKGWNPTSIYHSICAFANDFDNLGGGYILVGVEQDEKGLAKRPIVGIEVEKIDGILKDMVGFNNKIDPYYLPRTSVESIDGKSVIAIWVPSGVNRPYAVSTDVTLKGKCDKAYYIRSGTSSIVAKGESLDQLRDMANRVPFDERPNPNITLADISMVLLRDYLAKVKSRLEQDLFTQPLERTLEQMDLMTGPTENRMLKNVAAMMFCEHPEKFFKYAQTDIVIFPEGRINGPDNFSETTIYGSVPQQVNGALTYLKNTLIREYVIKQKDVPESLRFFNYPIRALEEAVVNALYHRDYQQYEPVEISIEPEGIHILNFPGPNSTIPKDAITAGDRLISRRYRNRRLGDFLKELELTEGRSTGIPTIQRELKKNGSPRAIIETNDERDYINLFIPVHEGCGDTVVLNTSESSPKNSPKSSPKKRSKTSLEIEKILRKNPELTTEQIARLLGITKRAVLKNLANMKNIVVHQGPSNGGFWEFLDER